MAQGLRMDNVRAAVGQWLGRWYAQLVPNSKALQEYCARGLSKSVVMVPGRMIDAAEDMVNLWVRNDTDDQAGKRYKLPVALVAMARDMMPTGRDWGRALGDEEFIMIDTDPKERVFALRTHTQDVRCQIVFAAHEPDAARALAGQFALWVQGYSNKRFAALWPFAGQAIPWPCQLESDDVMASLVPTEAKNLTLLALDFTFKMTEPFYRAPRAAEGFDGKGSALPDGSNDPADPHGFPLVQAVRTLQSVEEAGRAGTAPMGSFDTTEAGTAPLDPPRE